MIFTDIAFLWFFAAVFTVYWLIRSNTGRIWFLLAASLGFYAAWDWRFLALIGAVIVITRLATVHLALDRETSPQRRTTVMLAAVLVLLGLLATFKYFGFFTESFLVFAQRMGLPAGGATLDVLLPVGLSFYIFQAMGLVLDAYDGRIREPGRFRDTAFFIAFFPQLVAGPIVRSGEFMPQIETEKRLRDVPWKGVAILFFGGWVKKAVIADNLALSFVDPVFADPTLYSSWEIFSAVLLYAVQIYCDFSGYSEMAIAVSRTFGFHLPVNFRAPYLATSLTDIWRRWHISLSTWIRDYVFVRIGGSAHGELATYRNLLITMVLVGLWHGAAWNMVLIGYLWGVVLIIERATRWPQLANSRPWMKPIGTLEAFTVACLTWSIFRAESIDVSFYVLTRFVAPFIDPMTERAAWSLALFAGLAVAHALIHRYGLGHVIARTPAPAFFAAGGLAVAMMSTLVRTDVQPFIYFQF